MKASLPFRKLCTTISVLCLGDFEGWSEIDSVIPFSAKLKLFCVGNTKRGGKSTAFTQIIRNTKKFMRAKMVFANYRS